MVIGCSEEHFAGSFRHEIFLSLRRRALRHALSRPERQKNHLAVCFGFGRSALNFKYVLNIGPNGVRNFCRIIRYELGDTFWTRDPDDC